MKQFYLVLSTSCGNRCVNCCVPSEILTEHATVSLSELKEIMSRYEIDENDVLEITGGEPAIDKILLHRSLDYLVTEIGFKPQFVNLLTHGHHFFDREYAELASRFIGHVSSTFYSTHENAHDFMAQTDGVFEKKCRGLRNMQELGVQLHIKYLLTKINYKTCVDFVTFCGENFPGAILVFALLDYSGEAWKNRELINVKMSHVRPYLEDAIDEAAARGIAVNVLFPMCLIDPSRWEAVISRDWSTTSLKKQVFIEPEQNADTRVVEVSELDWPDIRFREKPELCNGCALFERCVWERGGYSEMYSLEEELQLYAFGDLNDAPG